MSRKYHRANLIDEHGNVSALCFARPRAIDMKRASWTNCDDAVTCPKCLVALAELRKARIQERPSS
jgi:hypothetical protein